MINFVDDHFEYRTKRLDKVLPMPFPLSIQFRPIGIYIDFSEFITNPRYRNSGSLLFWHGQRERNAPVSVS